MTKAFVAQSIEQVNAVIKESVRNSERLVDLKRKLIKKNAEEQYEFDQIKNGNGKIKNNKGVQHESLCHSSP